MKPRFIHLNTIDSTNSYLLELASTDDIQNMVVSADVQCHGKGMGTNTWESEPFKNLTFSIALDTSFLQVSKQFQFSQSVAVALHQCLSNYLNNDDLLIKWPNDILFANHKLLGVLISNILKNNCMDLSIVGVGLNVNQTVFQEWPTHPVSMKMITGREFDLDDLLHSLVDSICRISESHKSGGYPEINEYYCTHLFRYQKWGMYLVDGEEVLFFMKGLDDFGRLVLCDQNYSEHVFDVKQIKFL